jgi:hypothetical protein
MIRKILLRKYILVILTFLSCLNLKATDTLSLTKFELPKFSTNKTGTLIGIQRGSYFFIQAGVEQQRKQLRLKKPNTLAWNTLFEYTWSENALGLRVGGWFKTNRIGFTYGADLLGASDFTKYNLALTPSIGFKLVGFHALVNYNLFFFQKEFNYNQLNLSIRYFISKRREFVKTN